MYQSRVEFTQQPVFKHRQLHVLLLIRSSDHGQIASIDNPRLLETGPPLAEGRKTQLKGKLDIQLSLDPPQDQSPDVRHTFSLVLGRSEDVKLEDSDVRCLSSDLAAE